MADYFSFLNSQLFDNGMLAVETIKDQFFGQHRTTKWFSVVYIILFIPTSLGFILILKHFQNNHIFYKCGIFVRMN